MKRRDLIPALGLAPLALLACDDDNVPYVKVPEHFHDYVDVPLEMGESLGHNTPVLTYEDLPSVLRSSLVNGSPVYQRIALGDTGQPDDLFYLMNSESGRMVHAENQRDVLGDYLFFDDHELVLVGSVTFDPPFEDYVEDTFPVAGLFHRKIPFMDDFYTVISAQRSGSGLSMYLASGSQYMLDEGAHAMITGRVYDDYEHYYLEYLGWLLMHSGESEQVSQHELEVLVVDHAEAKYLVNGEVTEAMQFLDMHTLSDGTRIMQEFVTATQAAFYWDADLIYIADEDIADNMPGTLTVFRNGEVLEDVVVRINGSWSGNDLELRTIEWGLRADAVLGDLFIGEGESLRQHLDEPDSIPGRRLDLMYMGRNAAGEHVVRLGATHEVIYDIHIE